MNQKIIKLIILVLVLTLAIRLYSSSNTIESFDNHDSNILSNMIEVIRLKQNTEDNSYDLIFNDKYYINNINIVTNALNSNMKYIIYYLDDDNNYNENFVLENDELQHYNKPDSVSGKLISNNPRISGNSKVLTSSIKVKLLNGEAFDIKKYNIYGHKTNFVNTPNKLMTNINRKININKVEKSTVPNTGENVFKLVLDNQYSINGLEFLYDIENNSLDTTQNKSFPVEIHYSFKLENGNTATYKLNSKYYTNDHKLSSNGFVTKLFFEREINTDTLFLKMPKKIVLNDKDYLIVKVDNFVALVNNKESFENTETSNNSNKSNQTKESFQSTTEYAADELCPSLSGIENQMKLADTICERIEYNDKIKNERLKLERNKQYILKLKSQDEEIDQLEKIINELQKKRNKRDTYNDSIRLAQLQEQKKKAVMIKELANKRINHKNDNQVNVELNLTDKPTF